jgi:DNA polymerase-3 subunit delta'
MIYFTPERLLAFFRHNRFSLYHAFLLLGPQGLGKTALARKLASLLLCQHKGEESPCGHCASCVKVASLSHPDVSFISAGDKKGITIEQIRDVACDAHQKPWEGNYRVFILEDVHRMREEAANALLKTLEEPPAYVVFLLTAENEHAVLPTVLSRCQIFPIGEQVSDIAAKLVSDHRAEPGQARVAAALYGASIEEALDMLQNRWQLRNKMFGLFLDNHDPIEAAQELSDLMGEGEEARQRSLVFFDYLASFWRDILLRQHANLPAANNPLVLHSDMAAQIDRLAQLCNPTVIWQLIEFLSEQARAMIACNVAPRLLWELIYLRLYILLRRK